jgi:hypothetical protein
MRKISLSLFFAAMAFGQTDAPVPGNGHMIMSGSVTLNSGVMLRYKSMLSWTGGKANDPGHGLGEGGAGVTMDRLHRLMTDRVKGTYFGYDLVVRTADSAASYLVSFQPLTQVENLLTRMHGGTALIEMPPPKFPEPQVVHDGDTIALDLMESPDGRSKVTDYIEVLSHEPEPPAAKTTAEPKDFTVDDGPVKFDVVPRITVLKQGQAVHGGWGISVKPGATFWIQFPGQGRYILSLVPHEGFVKAGAIRDNVILFEDAGVEYEVRFMSPIAGAGKAWNLYLLHDPTYEVERKSVTAGVGRLEDLLVKE